MSHFDVYTFHSIIHIEIGYVGTYCDLESNKWNLGSFDTMHAQAYYVQ